MWWGVCKDIVYTFHGLDFLCSRTVEDACSCDETEMKPMNKKYFQKNAVILLKIKKRYLQKNHL